MKTNLSIFSFSSKFKRTTITSTTTSCRYSSLSSQPLVIFPDNLLKYRSSYPPVQEVVLSSRRDVIPYEMIGDVSLHSSDDCDKDASRLVLSDDREFFGLDLRRWNRSRSDEIVISLPIHFNYQRARESSSDDSAEYATVRLHAPSLYWKFHDPAHPFIPAVSFATKRANGVEVKRMFRYSYLGREYPHTERYFEQLNSLIADGSYQPIPLLQSELSVRIPVGNVADYEMTALVTHLVTIAGLLSLIFRILLMIWNTRTTSAARKEREVGGVRVKEE